VIITIEGGTCTAASVALTNLSDTPVYCAAAVEALVGSSLDDAAIKAAVTAAVDASDPVADTRGPVDFKKHVAGVIVKKAITSAVARA
jgi:carbon-monoxide dehydrogenase medium subunit